MKSKNKMIFRAYLLAGFGMLAMLPGVSQGDEKLSSAEVAAAKPAAGSVRAVRAPLSSERINALLAEIPEDHPMRDELRQVVRQGPPEGFTPEEWLRLAMKFNFRMPGSQRLRQSDSN